MRVANGRQMLYNYKELADTHQAKTFWSLVFLFAPSGHAAYEQAPLPALARRALQTPERIWTSPTVPRALNGSHQGALKKLLPAKLRLHIFQPLGAPTSAIHIGANAVRSTHLAPPLCTADGCALPLSQANADFHLGVVLAAAGEAASVFTGQGRTGRDASRAMLSETKPGHHLVGASSAKSRIREILAPHLSACLDTTIGNFAAHLHCRRKVPAWILALLHILDQVSVFINNQINDITITYKHI